MFAFSYLTYIERHKNNFDDKKKKEKMLHDLLTFRFPSVQFANKQ